MNLERKVNEGGNIIQTSIDLTSSTLATIGAYNLAGAICNSNSIDSNSQFWLTAGILTAGAIAGYKARSIFNYAKKRIKRNKSRTQILNEISRDEEFIERQGIERKNLDPLRSSLKYITVTAAGGALGYFPGMFGITPLCFYFGDNYNWKMDAALTSGRAAGPAIAAYSFIEMAAKKQYKRLATTASALAGTAAGYGILENCSPHLRMLESEKDLWTGIGILALSTAVGGVIGNQAYKAISKKYQSIKPTNKIKNK